MIKQIKKYIPSLWKMQIKSIISKEDKFKNLEKKQKKIIIALAADYGNLGDIAITYAQKEFLSTFFKEYQIIELSTEEVVKNIKSLRRKITKKDIITIVGGGNIGDLYQSFEDERKFIIKNFKNNTIISFPQTMDFSKGKQGIKSKRSTQKIYNKHKKLLLFARENKSYQEMKKIFNKCSVKEMPDIVLFLNKYNDNIDREPKVIFCMRQDREKIINDNYKNEIYNFILSKNLKIEYQDTHIGNINLSEKYKIFEDILNKFSLAKLVITDRLHGMIFCAITGTPCIAFDNSNGKVNGVYNRWLKNLKYIKLMDNETMEEFNYNYKLLERYNNEKKDKEILNDIRNSYKKMRNNINQFIEDN